MIGHGVTEIHHGHERLATGERAGIFMRSDQCDRVRQFGRIVIGERPRLHASSQASKRFFARWTGVSWNKPYAPDRRKQRASPPLLPPHIWSELLRRAFGEARIETIIDGQRLVGDIALL